MDLTRDETREVPAAPATAPANPPATQLPYAVATWLQRVDAAAHPKARLPGTPGPNRFGPDPKDPSSAAVFA